MGALIEIIRRVVATGAAVLNCNEASIRKTVRAESLSIIEEVGIQIEGRESSLLPSQSAGHDGEEATKKTSAVMDVRTSVGGDGEDEKLKTKFHFLTLF